MRKQKVAVLSVIFCVILLGGVSESQYRAFGEEGIVEVQDPQIQSENQEVVENSPVEADNGLQVVFKKNPESIEDIIPNKVYELEDFGDRFAITSEESVSGGENEKTNFLAIGTDQNDEDFYVIQASCAANQKNCEAAFKEYIINFRK